MKRSCAGWAVAFGMLLAGEAAAESKELVLQAGDRIRYKLGDEQTGKGVLREIGPDWLLVEDKRGATLTLQKSALQSLAVARGKKRRPLEGAMIGFLPGAAAGALLVWAVCATEGCSGAGGWALGPVIVGGGMTAVVGAGVGALIKTDRWQQAPVSRVRFGVAPAKGGGVRAALTLSF